MMKQLYLLILVLVICGSLSAKKIVRSHNIAKFSVTSLNIRKIAKNYFYKVKIKAKIKKGWYLYAAKQTRNDGPIATSINFDSKKLYAVKLRESRPQSKWDEAFSMNTRYFQNKAKFQLTGKSKYQLKKLNLKARFMVCNENMCLPPSSIKLKAK